VVDPPAARVWLDAERVTLTTVSAYTDGRGWPGHATGLASTLFRYLEVGGHYPDAVAIHTHALHAARDAGDNAGEAHALTNLGAVYWRQGRYGKAAEHHQQALALFREIGHRAGEAMALNGVGETYHATGHHEQAHAHHAAALTLATELGDRYEQARSHNGLAHTHHAAGDPDQGRHHWCQALALYTDLGVPEADDVHSHLTALDQADGRRQRRLISGRTARLGWHAEASTRLGFAVGGAKSTRTSSIRPGLSVGRAARVERAILDAAEERCPGIPAEDEGEAVGVMAVPHRDRRPVPSGSAPASTQLPPPLSL